MKGEKRLKYLVLSTLRLGISLTATVKKAITAHYDHVKKLESIGKLEVHYPLLGRHGGVSIYDVESHEELQRPLVQKPLFNSNEYKIYPLLEYASIKK